MYLQAMQSFKDTDSTLLNSNLRVLKVKDDHSIYRSFAIILFGNEDVWVNIRKDAESETLDDCIMFARDTSMRQNLDIAPMRVAIVEMIDAKATVTGTYPKHPDDSFHYIYVLYDRTRNHFDALEALEVYYTAADCVENVDADQVSKALDIVGVKRVYNEGGGDCMYRSVAQCVFGDEKRYPEVKQAMIPYLEQIINSDIRIPDDSIGKHRPLDDYTKEHSWGDIKSLLAISRLLFNTYECAIEVYRVCDYQLDTRANVLITLPFGSIRYKKTIRVYLEQRLYQHYTALVPATLSNVKLHGGRAYTHHTLFDVVYNTDTKTYVAVQKTLSK